MHDLTLFGEIIKGPDRGGLQGSTPQSVRSVDGLYKRVRSRRHRSGASCRKRPRGLYGRVRARGPAAKGRAFYEVAVRPVASGVLPAGRREGRALGFSQRPPQTSVSETRVHVLVPSDTSDRSAMLTGMCIRLIGFAQPEGVADKLCTTNHTSAYMLAICASSTREAAVQRRGCHNHAPTNTWNCVSSPIWTQNPTQRGGNRLARHSFILPVLH